jgi:hypothetical protein
MPHALCAQVVKPCPGLVSLLVAALALLLLLLLG